MSRTLDITDKFRQSQVPLYHHHHPSTADHRVKVATVWPLTLKLSKNERAQYLLALCRDGWRSTQCMGTWAVEPCYNEGPICSL